MQMPFSKYSKMRKLENSIFILILLLIVKIVFPITESFLINFLFGTLAFSSVYFFTSYLDAVLIEKIKKPLSIVLNIGILTAVIFFLASVSNFFDANQATEFANNVFKYVLVQIFLIIIIFIKLKNQ